MAGCCCYGGLLYLDAALDQRVHMLGELLITHYYDLGGLLITNDRGDAHLDAALDQRVHNAQSGALETVA